jgi:hypothetical protein
MKVAQTIRSSTTALLAVITLALVSTLSFATTATAADATTASASNDIQSSGNVPECRGDYKPGVKCKTGSMSTYHKTKRECYAKGITAMEVRKKTTKGYVGWYHYKCTEIDSSTIRLTLYGLVDKS